MISVVIPLFNKQHTVRRALQSVLLQTFQDFEIVVVNDGSTDASLDEVRRFRDRRIRVVSQSNAGVSATRNRGVAEAGSGLIAFLDADDEWLPEFLETIQSLRGCFQDCLIYATLYTIQAPNGRRWNGKLKATEPLARQFVVRDYFELASRSHPPVSSSAVAVKKQALIECGGFPIGVSTGEDLLTWARLAAIGRIALCTSRLAVFHQTDEVASRSIPAREPDPADPVGLGLKALLDNAKAGQQIGLQKYIGGWHKMRASVYLRSGKRLAARRELSKALGYSPAAPKLYLYLLLLGLPTCLVRWLFVKFAIPQNS